MKRNFLKTIIMIGSILPLFTACNGFFESSSTLRGETISEYLYYFAGSYVFNSHNYITLTFDENGTGGDVEIGILSSDYPTAAAEAGGTYADKTYFLSSGFKGSFTYDEETHEMVMNFTEAYYLKDGSLTTYQADYEWVAGTEYIKRYYGIDADSFSMSLTTCANPSADGLGIYQISPNGYYYYPDGDSWTANYRLYQAYTAGSDSETSDSAKKSTYTISGSSIIYESTTDSIYTQNSAVVSESHRITTRNLAVKDFYISGEVTGDIDFNDAWKAGNAVTFIAEGEVSDIYYESSQAPTTVPELNEYGYGSVEGYDADGNYYYYDLYTNSDYYSFVNYGDFIGATYNATAIFRSANETAENIQLLF